MAIRMAISRGKSPWNYMINPWIGLGQIFTGNNFTITGWWFGTMEFYDFPYIGNVIIPTD